MGVCTFGGVGRSHSAVAATQVSALVVVFGDFPANHERLLDGGAVGAGQAEVLVHCLRDAGEYRRRAAVARAERDHDAALVRLRAEPFREAALADAGFPDEGQEVLPLRSARHEF